MVFSKEYYFKTCNLASFIKVAACWSVLRCIAMCCSVLRCIAMCCSVMRISVPTTCLFPVAACCGMLQCVAAWWVLVYLQLGFQVHCNTLQHAATRCNRLHAATDCSFSVPATWPPPCTVVLAAINNKPFFVILASAYNFPHQFLFGAGATHMGWLRLVGSLKLQVSFAKEPYKRDHMLQKRHRILMSLPIVATP